MAGSIHPYPYRVTCLKRLGLPCPPSSSTWVGSLPTWVQRGQRRRVTPFPPTSSPPCPLVEVPSRSDPPRRTSLHPLLASTPEFPTRPVVCHWHSPRHSPSWRRVP